MPGRTIFIALSLALLPSGLSAQRIAQDSAFVASRPQPVALAILGGVAGSAVGFTVGGVSAGGLGSLAGSVFGAALGANYMARKGGAAPSLRSSLGAAATGLFAGFWGVMAAAQINEDDPSLLLMGFSVGQGTLSGLWAALR